MDKYTWSLDELYTSFNSKKFKNDYKKLEENIKNITLWCKENFETNENAAEKCEYYINYQNNMLSVASSLSEYTQLFMSTDAENEQAAKTMDKLEVLLSDLTAPETMFQKWFASLENQQEIILSSSVLKEHAFYLNEILENSAHLLSEKEEEVISKMKNTGSLAWAKLQELLTSTLNCKVEINGEAKDYPLPAVRNMAYEDDENIRKAAYKAELKALETIAPSSAACLNSIKGEVITECRMRGYTSPLDMTAKHSRLDREVLDAMISAMKDALPEFRKYFLWKAEIMGDKNGLPFYNLFAPVGKSTMKFTYEEAQNFIVKNFSSFSTDLGNYAKKAFDNRWIDVYPKNGKRGGAFCSNLHSIGESRILTNFTSSFSDVLTLAHELGHGYHGEQLNSETYLNSDYPMPIAETASTFCETLVKNAALKTASPDDALMILETDISDNAQIIVDILCRFLFEDAVFEGRKEGSLSHNELASLMLQCQKDTYGEGLDNEYMHKYMWVCKPHYYDAEYNYYNFPYAFGLLFAKGLYALYIEKGDAFTEDYRKLLSATGKANLKDVALMADIDITDKTFWKTSLDLICEDIKKLIEMKI